MPHQQLGFGFGKHRNPDNELTLRNRGHFCPREGIWCRIVVVGDKAGSQQHPQIADNVRRWERRSKMTSRLRRITLLVVVVTALTFVASTASMAIFLWQLTTKAVYNPFTGAFLGYKQDIGPSSGNPLKDVLAVSEFRLSVVYDPLTALVTGMEYVLPFDGPGLPSDTGPGYINGITGSALPAVPGHPDIYTLNIDDLQGGFGPLPVFTFYTRPGDFVVAIDTTTGQQITYGPDEIGPVTIPEPSSFLSLMALAPLAALRLRRR